jgi:NADH-quinone oxidoreductase subunit J
MLVFYLCAAVAVGTSIAVVAQRNPIYGVLLLIASFGALSGLYILLDAPFVAVIQIIVYAGAIMVLFLFVVMLLHAGEARADGRRDGSVGVGWFGSLLAVLLGAELVWALTHVVESGAFGGASVSSVGAIGRRLFEDYGFAFEVTSILILVAMVGAVVLARRERGGR